MEASVLGMLRKHAEAMAAYTLCIPLLQLVNKGKGLKLSNLPHGARLIMGRRWSSMVVE